MRRRPFAWASLVWLALGCAPSTPHASGPPRSAAIAGANADSPVLADVEAVGRFDRSDPAAWRFAWSGSELVARFSGTSVSVELDDPTGNDRFAVVIDGSVLGNKLVASPGRHRYELAAGLAPGTHEVRLHRLTEASQGETTFFGFRLGPGGALVAPPPRAARRIEVIGDSISAGYGDEGSDASCHFSPDTENHYLTYEAIAARGLGADLVTIAWSGKGVFSNRGSDTDTVVMPVLWTRILPERPGSVWDFAGPAPDVVVINLGTNDFAPGVKDVAPFAAAYAGFVRDVRARYPKATLFCTVGPMLTDKWPAGRKALSTAQRDVRGTVDALRREGDTRVRYLEFAAQTAESGYGCDWHPSMRTHARMARELDTAVRSAMGW